jgi:hypothetical protein
MYGLHIFNCLESTGHMDQTTSAVKGTRGPIAFLISWGLGLQRGNPNARLEFATRAEAIWSKYDCHPVKSLISPLVQAPIFIGFFSALRSFSAAQVAAIRLPSDPVSLVLALWGLCLFVVFSGLFWSRGVRGSIVGVWNP